MNRPAAFMDESAFCAPRQPCRALPQLRGDDLEKLKLGPAGLVSLAMSRLRFDVDVGVEVEVEVEVDELAATDTATTRSPLRHREINNSNPPFNMSISRRRLYGTTLFEPRSSQSADTSRNIGRRRWQKRASRRENIRGEGRCRG
ncbi:hypothetical protein TESG_02254 [Trichophyton tonsurans CBS 112818]|uniref:Uncharacterized protein n=1 Tax=Trichophyton tonsurans (strain CBS 112818) TaxID=647933 RepID=F2RTV0_TRIT1|nr:hypothetical protein TESG_02254 [Trichophyton tonsurans CBS 112818]